MRPLSRRRFVQTAAVAAAASQFPVALEAATKRAAPAWPENGTLIPDEGWGLVVDPDAEWKEDDLFLPEEVTRAADGTLLGRGQPMAVHAPKGGWEKLYGSAPLPVILPATVEQHMWGMLGLRPYTPAEYRYAATTPPKAPADDDVPKNGAYFGVSWWLREIEIPAEMQGKRILLHVRGARLRAEVFLNEQLVGYSIMEELPFECDLTRAAKPGGKNMLVIRVTNPFGRFDWVDGSNAKWGKLALYRSHGFGGLDRGMTVSAHSPEVRITDAWVLNTPQATKLEVFAKVRLGYGAGVVTDALARRIEDEFHVELLSAEGQPVAATISRARITSSVDFDLSLQCSITKANAMLWDLSSPTLYRVRVRQGHPEVAAADVRTVAVGFRSFGPTGLGSDAMFRLNGRRIRIYSAISWGYWGLNGLFPVPELAEKEVIAAKELGLNCLNFHRNLAKEDVLRKHDELGVLRYMEPGAGKLAIGKLPEGVATNAAGTIMEKPTSAADKFAQRYMFTKCVEMVKAFRSHPSVIEYCLQNEIGADLKNPDTLAVLKAMHDEDPSRSVVLNDGFVAAPRKAAQAWYAPWDDELKEGRLYRSDEEPWGEWWNQHQGAGDQWYDRFYKSPAEFTYLAPYQDVITEFGEMEGCARPDNHPLMVHQITETYKRYGGKSYDLGDHQQIIAGYEKFIAQWGFGAAFPTAESLFLACGRTEYESWQNYMENARLSDALDMAVISGWESTAIENHSGIVDNLRNFKSDPTLIAGSLLPVRPIAKQHTLVVEQGQRATFDLFLANDTPQSAGGRLTFSMETPSGARHELLTLAAPQQTPDVFTYLLREGFETPTLQEQGLYRFQFAISSLPLATQTKEIWVAALPAHSVAGLPWQVAVSGISPQLRRELTQLGPLLDIRDFDKDRPAHLLITSGMTAHTSATQSVGETTGTEANPINAVQTTTELGRIDPAVLDAVRAGTPLLCIPQADSLSDGCAQQLAEAGAFVFHGNVGDFRAPWMGNWYFGRKHPLFDGMPTDAALGGFYQIPGRESNGLLVERAPGGAELEVIVGYSRDHDRRVGAGTFATRLGKGKLLYQRVPGMHPVMQQRWLANAIHWLLS